MSALEKDAWRITFSEVKAAAEDIIEEARKGRMFILVDDEDRENEGDLVIPAQWATPETINFMAKHARGLICLALTRERVEQLGLALMAQNNGTRHQTAFTVSIEAREGVTTGISAADRARTVAVAIDPVVRAEGHRDARPRLPAGGARRRHAGTHRSYRGRGRPGAAGRAHSGRRDLRDHERRRHDGPSQRPDRLRPEAQSQDRHHLRPDRLSSALRLDRAAAEREHLRQRLWRRVPLRHLCEQGDDGPASRPGEGRSGAWRAGHGAHACRQHLHRSSRPARYRPRRRDRGLHARDRQGGPGRARADPRSADRHAERAAPAQRRAASSRPAASCATTASARRS